MALKEYDDSMRARFGGLVCGVDEVGRGAWAGPLAAAAVVLPPDLEIPGLTDSKKLSARRREEFHDQVVESALAYHVAWVWPDEIDEIGINPANEKAMREAAMVALAACPEPIAGYVVDQCPRPPHPSSVMIPKADSTSLCVAAASVVAKVARDRFMAKLGEIHPEFNFAKNKGYGDGTHLEALVGPAVDGRDARVRGVHRFSFRVKAFESALEAASRPAEGEED